MPEGPKDHEPTTKGEPTAELPPDIARYRGMLLELQNDFAKLREIIENNKDKPAIIFATRIADIPVDPGNIAFLNGLLTDHLETLNQEHITKDRKTFAAEMQGFFAHRMLRADAILQTYVLPSIDSPSVEVNNFADTVHQLAEKLRKGTKESLGVIFDDVQLMAPPQPNSDDYQVDDNNPDQWLPFMQCPKEYPPEVRTMMARMYHRMRTELEKDDVNYEEAKQAGRLDRSKLDQYSRVTDIRMWGYTRDGIRELPTEVTIKMGTRVLDHNLGPVSNHYPKI